MSYITWNDSLSVKIPAMNDQHKKLVDLINNLHDAMIQGKGKDQIEKTLNELVRYTSYHFESEERFLKSQGYEELASHQQIHDELKKQVLVFQEKYKNDEFLTPSQILTFLQSWLLHHIKEEDMKYSIYAKEVHV